jgi:hypothetical protein
MQLSVLISTTFRDPPGLTKLLHDLVGQTVPVGEVVIVIQRDYLKCFDDKELEHVLRHFRESLNLRYEIREEIGLSKSRNRALELACGDLLLIADDDCRYPVGLTQTIIDSCNTYGSADAWTFQVETPDGRPFKKYAPIARRHDFRSLMHASSIEIVLSKKVLAEGSALFDERFGLGATFPSGEENIMLVDLLRRGFKVQYVPLPIVVHDEHQRQLTSDHLYAKGAMFRRMFGAQGGAWLALFLAKKAIGHQLTGSMTASMVQGVKGYRDIRRMSEME